MTAPKVPSLVPVPFVKVTVTPVQVTRFPCGSRSSSSAVVVSPAASEVRPSTTVDCAVEGGGICTVIAGSVPVTAAPFTVAVIARAPHRVPVNVAV